MAESVRILVSHRIDLDCETVQNSLYLPMRCGAVYDQRPNITMAGDDTGDNISQKRMSYCEFTVQYWAWKNLDADYYGLCHYRRYLSFSDRPIRPVNGYGMGIVPVLSRRAQGRLGLLDPEAVSAEVRRWDAVIGAGCPVENIIPPKGPRFSTVKEAWDINEGDFFAPGTTDFLLELLDTSAPEYSGTARRYFASNIHFGFNCYVFKRALFQRLCQLQFPLLAQAEASLPRETLREYPRTIGYLGEILYGIFVYKLMEEGGWAICQRQIVYVDSSVRLRSTLQAGALTASFWLRQALRWVIGLILPPGSQRRTVAKRLFYSVFPKRGN